MKRITTILLALLVLIAAPSSALAGEITPMHGEGDHGTYPWNPVGDGHHSVAVCLNANIPGGATWGTGDYHNRISNAMSTWSAVYGQQVMYKYNGCPNNPRIYVQFGQNPNNEVGRLDHNHTACLEPWGVVCNWQATLTLDWSYFWYAGTGTPPAGYYDVQSVVVHEIGHMWGFPDITCIVPYVMCGQINPTQVRRTLHAHDISNLQLLYNH